MTIIRNSWTGKGVMQAAMSTQVRHAARITLLAAIYFALAKLSLFTAIPPGYATAVWPPSGLAPPSEAVVEADIVVIFSTRNERGNSAFALH